ncbi:DUF86 domain-containing protein [Actinomyces slackii]|uniref:Uncharacterized conserved protein n=1 Tax=Actinomyces slackii TaxID=52774 RepID=A0A3S4WIG7_9ACTO|nr:HepT-like ribonuclease domain-containing protein [Actinomyces slackii]VEG75727.1 Uncharacterized conserved protein [Actinomyces slackii]
MRPETPAHLWDALQAARAAVGFTAGVGYDQFAGDLMRRSAVERQIEILGEALNRIRRADPDVAVRIVVIDQVVGMRNIIVHEYGHVDDRLVWDAVTSRLPGLSALLEQLLDEADGSLG